MMKAVGTTENVSPVIVEAIKHAAMDLTPEQRELALEVLEEQRLRDRPRHAHRRLCRRLRRERLAPGHQDGIHRAGADLSRTSRRSSTPRPRGDATKAISDMRAYIAQKVDVIVMFADAGAGAAADRQGSHRGRHPRRPPQRHLCRRRSRQGLSSTTIAENICKLGTDFVKAVADNPSGPDRHRRARRHARQLRSAPAGRSAPTRRSPSTEAQAPRQGRHQLDAGGHIQGHVGLARPA